MSKCRKYRIMIYGNLLYISQKENIDKTYRRMK